MTPWTVIQSPTDAEMSAVQGAYLVADKLPIEDATLIASAPELLKLARSNLSTLEMQRIRFQHHGLSHAEIDVAIEESISAIEKATKA